MADVWVFPGGAVDGAGNDDAAHRATALRELEEEASVTLAARRTTWSRSRAGSRRRRSRSATTRASTSRSAPAHCGSGADGEEIVEVRWFAPAEALEQHRAGELLLVFPTIKKLETLARFGSPERGARGGRARCGEPILPRIDTIGRRAARAAAGRPGVLGGSSETR